MQDFAGISTEILRGQIMCNYHANRDEFGSKVVRITVCKSCPQQTVIDFTKALQEIRYAGLSYDFVDKTTKEEDSVSDSQAASLRTPATNKICSTVGLIERVMNDLDYRLHNGEGSTSKVYFCEKFQCDRFCACIAVQSEDGRGDCTAIISILSNSGVKFIRQIEFDYNLMEVKPQGCCF